MKSGSGVLYVAIGKQHFDEAVASLASLRLHSDISVTIVTDQRTNAVQPFNSVVHLESDPYRAKIVGITTLPYERTLYLDTDTFICGGIDNMFDVLDYYDIAGVQDAGRTNWPSATGVPRCFPELNTGVLLLRQCAAVYSLLTRWLQYFDDVVVGRIKYIRPGDQGALREAIYGSGIRLAIMPPEYNFRFAYPAQLVGSVVIMHGRRHNGFECLDDLRKAVNQSGRVRIYKPGVGLV